MGIRHQHDWVSERQRFPSGGIDAELRVHAAYNNLLDMLHLKQRMKIGSKESVRSSLANPQVRRPNFKSCCQLPLGRTALQIPGAFVLNEDNWCSDRPRLAGYGVDAVDGPRAI